MRQLKSAKYILILAMFSILAACSSPVIRGPDGLLRDPNADFGQAQTVPPLKMPPGVKPLNYDPYYVVPPVKQGASENIVSLLPPGSLAAKQAGQ